MKRLADQTLYEILEIPFDATPVAIAEAVERARSLYGPGSLATYTLMSTDEAALLGQRIEEAQSTLLDPAARAHYDELITRPSEPEPPPAPAVTNGRANGTLPARSWSLPPVIPALQVAPEPARALEEEDGEDDAPAAEAPMQAPVAAAPPPFPDAPSIVFSAPPAGARPPPTEPRAAAHRPAPILLSREVAPSPAPRDPAAASAPGRVPTPPPVPGPVATPVPGLTATPVPGPIATPVPLVQSPAPPLPPTDATAWSGEVLRRLREARGITLLQLSERTKVTRHHIENIEGDRYAHLPAAVYLRGILLSIARELRLDGQKVARSYLERVASAPKGR